MHWQSSPYFESTRFESEENAVAKIRLDQLLVDRELVPSHNKAQALIQLGKVLVNEVVIEKSGTRFKLDVTIRIRGQNQRFVSRGGEKLEGALAHFNIDCTGLTAADIGASTGGFTDCLLQRNIKKVYAIDVGYGQLAWTMRQHPNVIVMERCNARHLESLPEPIELIVGDVSFISITKILPAMKRIAAPNALGVLLIKPQFEVGRTDTVGGLVKDPKIRQEAIDRVSAEFQSAGCQIIGHVASSIAGAKKGNIEELVYLHFSK